LIVIYTNYDYFVFTQKAETRAHQFAAEVSFNTTSDLLDKTNFNSGGGTNLKAVSLSVLLT